MTIDLYLKNAQVVTEQEVFRGGVVVAGEQIAAVVRGEAEPLVSARDGLANLRVTEAIVAAAKAGSTIELH